MKFSRSSSFTSVSPNETRDEYSSIDNDGVDYDSVFFDNDLELNAQMENLKQFVAGNTNDLKPIDLKKLFERELNQFIEDIIDSRTNKIIDLIIDDSVDNAISCNEEFSALDVEILSLKDKIKQSDKLIESFCLFHELYKSSMEKELDNKVSGFHLIIFLLLVAIIILIILFFLPIASINDELMMNDKMSFNKNYNSEISVFKIKPHMKKLLFEDISSKLIDKSLTKMQNNCSISTFFFVNEDSFAMQVFQYSNFVFFIIDIFQLLKHLFQI